MLTIRFSNASRFPTNAVVQHTTCATESRTTATVIVLVLMQTVLQRCKGACKGISAKSTAVSNMEIAYDGGGFVFHGDSELYTNYYYYETRYTVVLRNGI